MFSPDNSQRQKKKNCKYRYQFCKSVQPFHTKEVCPTFWDRPLSDVAFLRKRKRMFFAFPLVFAVSVFFAYTDAFFDV